MISDSGRAFLDEVDANDDIDMVSSLFGEVGGYVADLNSFGEPKIDAGDETKLCMVTARSRLTSSLTELESRLDEPELTNDWRGSWLAVEFRRDSGGEERDIERCEAVSASSSSDSRNIFRGSEPVGEGGDKKLEAMIDVSSLSVEVQLDGVQGKISANLLLRNIRVTFFLSSFDCLFMSRVRAC